MPGDDLFNITSQLSIEYSQQNGSNRSVMGTHRPDIGGGPSPAGLGQSSERLNGVETQINPL